MHNPAPRTCWGLRDDIFEGSFVDLCNHVEGDVDLTTQRTVTRDSTAKDYRVRAGEFRLTLGLLLEIALHLNGE